MKASTILRRARQLLERDGWTRGAFRRGRRHCAIGAIWAVGPWQDWGVPVGLLEDVVGMRVDYWNDQKARTKAKVLEAFREAERRARKAEQ